MDFSRTIVFFILISVSQAIKYLLDNFKYLPKMVVFDFEYTLMPYWVEGNALPPFHRTKSGRVLDVRGYHMKMFEEAPKVLEYLREYKIEFSVCLSTHRDLINDTLGFLDALEWTPLFRVVEISTAPQETNVRRVSRKTNIPLSDMIYFDDEPHMVKRLDKIVPSMLIQRGMTMKELMDGFKKFDEYKKSLVEGENKKKSKKSKSSKKSEDSKSSKKL